MHRMPIIAHQAPATRPPKVTGTLEWDYLISSYTDSLLKYINPIGFIAITNRCHCNQCPPNALRH